MFQTFNVSKTTSLPTTAIQIYRPLPPGGNPFAVNKYHIISNLIPGSKTHVSATHNLKFV